MRKKKLVSIAEYICLAGITRQAVFNRVKKGTLKYAEHDPVFLIDINTYPPVKLRLGRKPFKSGYLSK